MTEQVWNFAGIEGGAGEVGSAVGTTAGLLDEGKGSRAALASVWGGSGSEASSRRHPPSSSAPAAAAPASSWRRCR